MKTLSLRRVLAVTGVLSLLLIYVLLWSYMIADPRQRSGSDFVGFYSYGRIAQTLGFGHIHDLDAQQRIQSGVAGFEVAPIFYTHLPFISPLAAILVDEDYVASFKRWAVVLLFLNALNTLLLLELAGREGFTREMTGLLAAGTFLFFPTFSGFMNGQDTAILLSGAALWALGVFSGKDFSAGLGLSLTTVRPQVALMLAIPFLFRRRRVLWGFVLGSLVLAGISLWLIGWEGAVRYVESLRYIEGTIWREPHSFDMPTISGILRRNFTLGDAGPVKAFVWSCYGLGIAAFCVFWRRSAQIGEKQLGLLTLGAIFLLPYAHYHDLILLLITVFCVIRALKKQADVDPYYLSVGPLLISVPAALGFAGSGTLKFPIAYALMLALGGLLLGSAKLGRKPAGQADD